MNTDAYTLGFLTKISEYEKHSVDDTIRKEREKRWEKEDRLKGAKKRKYELASQTISGDFEQHRKNWKRELTSAAKGVASAAAVAGTRAAQSVANYYTWAPMLVDTYLFGKLIGVDEGRGFLGRMRGGADRFADEIVHNARSSVKKYDTKYDTDMAGFNNFLNGAAADFVGSAAGFRSLTERWNPLYGLIAGASTLTPFERSYQLRKREKWLDSLPPANAVRINPLSTRANIENAPTPEEFKEYHMPSSDIPASSSGTIRIPFEWSHDEFNSPLWFKEPR